MTTTSTLPTESQLAAIDTQPLDFTTWKKEGESLVSDLRASEHSLERTQWDIGDWILRGDEKFKSRAYDAAEKITGFERSYLQTVVWVVKRFPKSSSLRKETNLSWSHFKELAYLEDDEARNRVLDSVDDGFKPSVRDLRELVRRELQRPNNRNPANRSKTDFVFLRVSLKPDQRRAIRLLAKARHVTPDTLLRKIVEEYFEENKNEIATKIKSSKQKSSRRGRAK